MLHAVNTEIGGMAICSKDDPLLVEDIAIIKQEVGAASVKFDDTAYANWVMEMCDPGGAYKLKPMSCQRIWIHTHPSGIHHPSGVDEETFHDAFGCADWAIMFILSKSGVHYARMRVNTEGPMRQFMIPVKVDFSIPFPGSDAVKWQAEITANVSNASPYVYQPTWTPGVPIPYRPAAPVSPYKAPVYDVSKPPREKMTKREKKALKKQQKQATQFLVTTSTHERKLSYSYKATGPEASRTLFMHPFQKLSRYALMALISDIPLQNRDIDVAMVSHLRSIGVTWARTGTQESPALFNYMTATGGQSYTASNRLVEMLPPSGSEVITERAAIALRAIEAEFITFLDECVRDLNGADNTGAILDLFDTPTFVFKPWVCLNSRIIWISPTEADYLMDVAAGVNDGAEFLCQLQALGFEEPGAYQQTGFFLPDDGDEATIPFSGSLLAAPEDTKSIISMLDGDERYASAFVEVLGILERAKTEGTMVSEIMADFRKRGHELRNRNWYNEFRCLIKQAIALGFDPENFKTKVDRVEVYQELNALRLDANVQGFQAQEVTPLMNQISHDYDYTEG